MDNFEDFSTPASEDLNTKESGGSISTAGQYTLAVIGKERQKVLPGGLIGCCHGSNSGNLLFHFCS